MIDIYAVVPSVGEEKKRRKKRVMGDSITLPWKKVLLLIEVAYEYINFDYLTREKKNKIKSYIKNLFDNSINFTKLINVLFIYR